MRSESCSNGSYGKESDRRYIPTQKNRVTSRFDTMVSCFSCPQIRRTSDGLESSKIRFSKTLLLFWNPNTTYPAVGDGEFIPIKAETGSFLPEAAKKEAR